MYKKAVDASPFIIKGALLICKSCANLQIDPGSINSFVCSKFVRNLSVVS